MTSPRPFRTLPVLVCSLTALLAPTLQGTVINPSDTATTADVIRLPEITVIAQKEPASAQSIPVSVTAVTEDTIKNFDIQNVKEASTFAPNVFVNEFTARKLSNPYVRGIGGSPTNPGVTTYIDGVPQLNATSSNIQLIDVNQIEFVRGPQGALYGRNTLGGLINITSRAPSLKDWTGGLESNFGSYNLRDVRMNLSAPIVQDTLGLGFAGGYSSRDGYTKNSFTGDPLDSRKAVFGKFQMELKATENYDARLILFAENDNDGDYALGDLKAVRDNLRRVDHNYQGYTHRDITAPTLLQTLKTDVMDITSITGGVWWRTADSTDLDYTKAPLATRLNNEREYQLTQEFRFASPKDAPIKLSDDFKLAWQGGIFAFYQKYDQNAASNVGTNASYPYDSGFGLFMIPIHAQTLDQTDSTLKNWGTGVYGQTTLTAWEQLDFILGLRYDYEKATADLNPLTTTAITSSLIPPWSMLSGSGSNLDSTSSSVSPQFGLAWHVTPDAMVYGKITRGFKAGGFNPNSPLGKEGYDPETSWSYELGTKTEWLGGKLRANAALYYIDWSNMQLNMPMPLAPQYYIDNVGSAHSEGAELELGYRPLKCLEFFGSVGCTDARFDSNSLANCVVKNPNGEIVNVSGNRLPYTPRYTANLGTQAAWDLDAHWTLYARAEVTFYGDFAYDAANLASQGSYNLADARVGVRKCNWFAECWVANAFNSHYVPLAFEYNNAWAPSGFVGESGAPMTVGVRAGVSF